MARKHMVKTQLFYFLWQKSVYSISLLSADYVRRVTLIQVSPCFFSTWSSFLTLYHCPFSKLTLLYRTLLVSIEIQWDLINALLIWYCMKRDVVYFLFIIYNLHHAYYSFSTLVTEPSEIFYPYFGEWRGLICFVVFV